jgi:hypothetical protein
MPFPHLDIELFTEGVHAGNTNPVESAGNLVRRGIELAARVELGQHDLQGGHPLPVRGVHLVYRDSPAVIRDGDGVVDVDGDVDAGGKPGQGLVDRVINDLVHQVVQSLLARGAYVHRGTQTHRFQTFKDLNVVAGVGIRGLTNGGRGNGGGNRDLFGRHSGRLTSVKRHSG